ncbi:hypothetical protein [Pseudonocardia spinosispora]|uniref:hypothetical protein n=1 Tax=Pseudonocardia spinosispora TaxID=103441 RepID=UPI0012ECA1F6|nr:hypothetical protein [Pseudonocardia spinosispora]
MMLTRTDRTTAATRGRTEPGRPRAWVTAGATLALLGGAVLSPAFQASAQPTSAVAPMAFSHPLLSSEGDSGDSGADGDSGAQADANCLAFCTAHANNATGNGASGDVVTSAHGSDGEGGGFLAGLAKLFGVADMFKADHMTSGGAPTDEGDPSGGAKAAEALAGAADATAKAGAAAQNVSQSSGGAGGAAPEQEPAAPEAPATPEAPSPPGPPSPTDAAGASAQTSGDAAAGATSAMHDLGEKFTEAAATIADAADTIRDALKHKSDDS